MYPCHWLLCGISKKFCICIFRVRRYAWRKRTQGTARGHWIRREKGMKNWRMFKYYGSTESECYEAQFDFHAGGYYKQSECYKTLHLSGSFINNEFLVAVFICYY